MAIIHLKALYNSHCTTFVVAKMNISVTDLPQHTAEGTQDETVSVLLTLLPGSFLCAGFLFHSRISALFCLFLLTSSRSHHLLTAVASAHSLPRLLLMLSSFPLGRCLLLKPEWLHVRRPSLTRSHILTSWNSDSTSSVAYQAFPLRCGFVTCQHFPFVCPVVTVTSDSPWNLQLSTTAHLSSRLLISLRRLLPLILWIPLEMCSCLHLRSRCCVPAITLESHPRCYRRPFTCLPPLLSLRPISLHNYLPPFTQEGLAILNLPHFLIFFTFRNFPWSLGPWAASSRL